MRTLVIIGAGGFVGANVRYLLATWLTTWLTAALGWSLPYGTVFVNISGSFLLAVFAAWAAKQINFSDELRLLVATGFFGAYTTFSTYALESMLLLRGGQLIAGIGNIVLTNSLCLLGVVLGLMLGSRL